jgi:CubicO group peptidase (beta-lactamase class C family)
LALFATPVAAETPDEVARRYGLAGEVLVAKGGKVLLDRGYGTIAPSGGAKHKAGERWRLASITKQVTAALIARRMVNGSAPDGTALAAALDRPARMSLGGPMPGGLTARQLLTHHTGLANPDTTTVDRDGVPAYYRGGHDPDFCLSKAPKPGAPFAYNNCDYALAAALLPISGDWPAGMRMARPRDQGIRGFVGGKREPHLDLSYWGAAGGLMGTARAVFDFDRSLMTGKLLPPAALAELWKPEGNGSYQALGQWVFPGKLKGCAAPKRIVQRDGEIYGMQARNFILPDDDLVVIAFTNRSADDFAIGEVWQGKGFAYDLLSAAACQ